MEPDVERLQWQCRRGMLELDYILRDFLDQKFPGLDADGRKAFERLLGCADQDLHDWIMGYRTAGEAELDQLVEQLRRLRAKT